MTALPGTFAAEESSFIVFRYKIEEPTSTSINDLPASSLGNRILKLKICRPIRDPIVIVPHYEYVLHKMLPWFGDNCIPVSCQPRYSTYHCHYDVDMHLMATSSAVVNQAKSCAASAGINPRDRSHVFIESNESIDISRCAMDKMLLLTDIAVMESVLGAVLAAEPVCADVQLMQRLDLLDVEGVALVFNRLKELLRSSELPIEDANEVVAQAMNGKNF